MVHKGSAVHLVEGARCACAPCVALARARATRVESEASVAEDGDVEPRLDVAERQAEGGGAALGLALHLRPPMGTFNLCASPTENAGNPGASIDD